MLWTRRDRLATSGCALAWPSSSLGLNPGRRSHLEQEYLLDAPGMNSQPSGHGRCGRYAKVFGGAQFVMHHTPVVDTSDEIHARLKRFQPMGSMTAAARQGGQTLAEGSIQPLDKGGVEHASTLRLGQKFLSALQRSLRHASRDLDDAFLL